MAQTPNNTGIMSRRQSFNGKGLTFVEVIFAQSMTGTATTPDTKDSDFQKVSEVVREKGNLLAQSYRLGAKATDNDAAEATIITANNSIDSYQFIYEGTPGAHNTADSVGDINLDPHQNETSAPAVIADQDYLVTLQTTNYRLKLDFCLQTAWYQQVSTQCTECSTKEATLNIE